MAALRRRLPVAALALVLAAGAARAEKDAPAAVMSSESEHYRRALEGFTEAWGSTVAVIGAGAPLPSAAWAFTAIGGKAAARRWPHDAIVVACLSPSVSSDENDAMTRVSLMPEPAVLVDRIRALAPKLRVMSVFWSSESSRDDVEALRKAGDARGLTILSERVDPPGLLPERLRASQNRADALWLMPDPALVSAENFAILREYAAAKKLPFFAPTEGLAERGATATIAATFRDMGGAAARSLRARLAGSIEPETVYVSRVIVTVNGPAAVAAGLGPNFEMADKVLP